MQQLFSGYNSIQSLSEIIQRHCPKRIFLVFDKDSYELSGAQQKISFILTGRCVTEFSDFEKNPRLEDIIKGIDFFDQSQSDFIIALGGGSVIDMAKSISLLVAQQKTDLPACLENKINLVPRKVPLVLIPSTAGSGSEATHFAVIYKDKIKYSLSHCSLIADYAILDPFFIETLPAYVAAYTGMDALCQGIESLWSVNSTDISRQYSKKAISLAIENLAENVQKPTNRTRESMLFASYYSGKAINIAQTTMAHSVSYPLTSYFGIPHGHAVAVTLPYFLLLNTGVTEESLCDRRGVSFVQERIKEIAELFNVSDPEKAAKKFLILMEEVGVEARLGKMGLRPKDLPLIVQHGFNPQRAKNNPRTVTEDDLYKLLEIIL